MAAGYIVEEADNGEDAAHLGSTGEFDAIVLDLGLPVIDGLTVMARLALITAVWSAVALLVTGVILTELFRSDAEREFDARIAADLVHLVRDAAGRPAGEPALPVEPLGPLFREPFSGWAWQVRRGDQIVAQSGSLGPLIDGVMEPLRAPGTAPADFIAPGGIASRGAARPILLGGESEPLIFAVARPRAEIDGSLSYFSTLLLYSLAVFGAVMFAGSLLLTRIMLAPVTRLEEAVRRMRDGETAPLDGRWPREIVPVIGELKDLDTHIDRLIERSRNQTSDLAHALRTPLSIMRQAAERAAAGAAEPLIALLEQGRKRQLLTVTQDGAGLGRVLDQRPGLPERRFTGDAVFPLGVWAQGEVREFEATEFTLFGPARHLITLEILDIDHVYDGVAHSLGYRLTIRDEAGRELDCEVSLYSPGRGLVAFEARSYWQNGGCNT